MTRDAASLSTTRAPSPRRWRTSWSSGSCRGRQWQRPRRASSTSARSHACSAAGLPGSTQHAESSEPSASAMARRRASDSTSPVSSDGSAIGRRARRIATRAPRRRRSLQDGRPRGARLIPYETLARRRTIATPPRRTSKGAPDVSRPATGTVETRTLGDGTRVFKLRFYVDGRREHEVLHERRSCACGCGGSWNERTAAVELDNVLARVRAGVWRKRNPPPPVRSERIPTFHEYASIWLQAKIDGVLGDRPIGTNTESDYRSRLANHLLPFFGEYQLDEIDADLCLAFKAHKLQEAAELRRAIEAGAVLRDRRGRRVRPLGPAMIRKLAACLTTILDEAVDDGHLARNPARSRRMRIRVPKPSRTFLEMDELVALTDAAGEQDAASRVRRSPVEPQPGSTAAKVAERWTAGLRASDIAAELGIARRPSPTTCGVCRLRVRPPTSVGEPSSPPSEARAFASANCATCVSATFACMRRAGALPHPRREDRRRVSARCRSSPDLFEELVAHVDRLGRAGLPTDPDAYLFPNVRGGRMSRQRANRSSARQPRWRRRTWPPAVCPRFRTRRRTRCVARTSRSRCWPTASTCSG